MKISRDVTLMVHFVFDQLLPPILRDSKWFMWVPFKVLFKDKAHYFFEFKDKAYRLNESEFLKIYQKTASVHLQRETNINTPCLKAIDENIIGKNVLDIACGRGFLLKRLSGKYNVTAADITIDKKLKEALPGVKFYETRLENLPFKDKEFETVICAHTLEHVQDMYSAISELRRVTAKRLIVIAPKQRPYKYTFDLHVNFFPYATDLLKLFSPEFGPRSCVEIGGDLFYMEDIK